jgi:hypothetical protein
MNTLIVGRPGVLPCHSADLKVEEAVHLRSSELDDPDGFVPDAAMLSRFDRLYEILLQEMPA